MRYGGKVSMMRKPRLSTTADTPFWKSSATTKSATESIAVYSTLPRTSGTSSSTCLRAGPNNLVRQSSFFVCERSSTARVTIISMGLSRTPLMRRPAWPYCCGMRLRLTIPLSILLCLVVIGNLQPIQNLHAREGDPNEKNNWDKAFRPSVLAPLGISPDTMLKSATFLPDGRHLLTGGEDGLIIVWDLFDKVPVVTIRGPGGSINSLSVSSNGRLLAQGYRNMHLYDIETWKRLDSFGWPEDNNYDEVYQAFLFANGRNAVLRELASVSIVDLATKHKRKLDVIVSPLPKVAIDPSGRYVLIGRVFGDASPKDALLYDLQQDRTASRFRRIADLPDYAFSADGKYFAVTTVDGKAQIRRVPTGALVKSYPGRALGFSPQGLRFAVLRLQRISGQEEVYMVDVWDTDSNMQIATIGPVDSADDLAFSPTGRFLATSGSAVVVWDLERKEEPFSPSWEHAPLPYLIRASSQDDSALAAIYDEPLKDTSTVRLWNYKLGTPLVTPVSPAGVLCHDVLQREDGHWVAVGKSRDQIVLVQLTGDFQIAQLTTAERSCGLRISPDGTKCAVIYYPPTIYRNGKNEFVDVTKADDDLLQRLGATRDKPGKIEIWDVTNRQLLHSLAGAVTCARFDNSGRWLFAGYVDGNIRKWNANTGELASTYQAGKGRVFDICVSANGRRMLNISVTGDMFNVNSRVFVWDRDKDRPIAELDSLRFTAVAVSADGATAAIGTWDGVIFLWDCINCSQIARWQAHDGTVTNICFLAGANRIVSTGSDGRCLIWSIPHGREIASLWHTPNSGWFCSTPEGYFDYDGDEATLSYIRHVDLRTLRLLSPEESRNYYRPEVVRRALARQAGD